ncbi:uncharacterized protein LOC110269463 [Arachis ipaensis]|uniref:uncharacterized protein LOC110269463 n=1 Tax=Arachis ipaensis TaxID=130454 RepID=UPI000A2B7D71|nr:uncharacterized protein LOC110269463 [Arachis ipaensis]
MSINKSWIGKPRTTHEYKDGLNKFLDFAFEHRSLAGRQIKCPCPVCGFCKWQTREKVFEHLIVKPFPENYKVWYWYGEEAVRVGSQVYQTSHIVQDDSTYQHPMVTMLNDAFGVAGSDLNEDGDGDGDEEHSGENVEFYKLLEDDKSAASNASQVKSAAAANSSRDTLAATNFSRDKSAAAANSSRDKSAAAANSSRDKSAASNSSRDKLAASNSSRDKLAAAASSSRDKSAASNSSEPSSVAPTISEHPSEPKRKRGHESKHYWTIDAIDEYEDSTRLHLLAKDVHNLTEGLRIVVNFDKHHAAIGEAAGLLAGVCGQLATDCVAFPISFDKWSDIPASFFENQWNIFFPSSILLQSE